MTASFLPPVIEIGSAEGVKLQAAINAARDDRSSQVEATVAAIIADVRKNGDKALFAYTKQFDKVDISAKTVRISSTRLKDAAKGCPAELRRTIRAAADRIRAYHTAQFKPNEFTIKTSEGRLSQRVLPLRRVGVYIPGGHTVYPSSVLMNVIPARIAGVKEIVAVTPVKGDLDPALAYVLSYLKVDEVYGVGGSQAIAALAYGTASIAPVDKIVGPGNAYVAAAKRQVYGRVDIDAVAGPSEVAVLCDKTADPRFVALDLLSQAEHGSGDEIALCVTDSLTLAKKVAVAVSKEIAASPVPATFAKLRKNAITVFVGKNMAECVALVNKIGPEHLEIQTASPRKILKDITNAAAIFLGDFTPVATGDYFVGTNHVLPTGGAARYASPLGVDSFLKRISVAECSRRGLFNARNQIGGFARAEGFVHHAMSVEKRFQE